MKNPFEEYPVIAFKDIQKGDTIAAVRKYSNALKSTMGVADMQANYGIASDYWYTEGGAIILVNSGMANTTIHLVDRPKPELPTETGSVILIKQYDGVVLEPSALALLDSAGDWFVPSYNKHRSAGVKEWIITANGKAKIEEWTLAEVKEVTA